MQQMTQAAVGRAMKLQDVMLRAMANFSFSVSVISAKPTASLGSG